MKLNIVPARTGIQWVKLGIRTFARQPLALTGLFFMYTATFSLLMLIPVVGVFLGLGIVPAATLGLMAATQEAEKGRFPMPTVLLSAFRVGKQRLRAMLVLGLIYAVACVAVMTIVPLIAGVPPAPAVTAAATGAEAAAAALTPQMQRALLMAVVFYAPLSLMFWHAPALVHWHGVAPVKSLFFSTVACMRNWRALTVFGLAWMAVLMVTMLIVGLVAQLIGDSQVAGAALAPLVLVVSVMFSTSLYFTFRDSFVADEPPPGEPT